MLLSIRCAKKKKKFKERKKMRIKLKNVGRIREADILIDGITVICGDNNTGKSTVGKSLYSIYSAFFDLQEAIQRERMDSIVRLMSSNAYYGNPMSVNANKAIEELVGQNNPTIDQIRDVVSLVSRGMEREPVKEATTKVAERIKQYLSVEEKDIATLFLQRKLIAEFGGQLANVNSSSRKADISLEMRDGIISFHTSGKTQKLVLDQYFNIEKKLIYLDDPFILDDVNNVRPLYRSRMKGHRGEMAGLIHRSLDHKHTNAIEEILHNREIQAVIQKMDAVSKGELISKDGLFYYKHENLKEEISLTSVSTGVKTFAILRTLLMSGYLEENGIIVFDEPEVHLHPDWQIKLAEMIVMLQKAYGLNAIITTHSNDFLLALDYYSKEYDTRANCHFYLTEVDKKSRNEFPGVLIKDKTEDMESMYSSVSDPYLRLYSKMEGV